MDTSESKAGVLADIDTVLDMEDSCGGDEYCGSTSCSGCGAIARAFGGLKTARADVAELLDTAAAVLALGATWEDRIRLAAAITRCKVGAQ